MKTAQFSNQNDFGDLGKDDFGAVVKAQAKLHKPMGFGVDRFEEENVDHF